MKYVLSSGVTKQAANCWTLGCFRCVLMVSFEYKSEIDLFCVAGHSAYWKEVCEREEDKHDTGSIYGQFSFIYN
jgi:hypothetical protein